MNDDVGRSKHANSGIAAAVVPARFFVTTLFVLATVLPPVGGIASAASPCGDVDCSGTVLARDALIVLKTAVGLDAGAQCACPPVTSTTTLSPSCFAADVPDFVGKLAASRCVAYSPSGDWNPNTGQYPTAKSVSDDLALLRSTGFDCIVTYGADHVLADIPCMAKAAGFGLVIMGIWDPRSEVERAGAVAASECADAYNVGNEGLTNPYCCGAAYSWDDLLSAVSSLRTETCRPVTSSEPIGAYLDGVAGHSASEMRGLGDWVFANAHPYFAGKRDAASAAAWSVEQYQTLLTASGAGRFVMFKETGMPSAGDTGLSEENQKNYFAALLQTQTRFAAFEAFDQAWKQNLPVEPHWGIYRSDRTPKTTAGVFAGG
ncbi:MAG TPA: glycosyl hydrolase family 17 protein [Candidatus Binatia bacterium]|jgi:exo-beta-1,3-glucanase (GH17 family)